MRFRVTLQKDEEDGYAVSVPCLPGCWSQGATEQEALANIAVAIQEHLEAVESELVGCEVREVEVGA